MSLIDEALKRAQTAETQAKPPEGERSRPWSPPPLPDRTRLRRRQVMRVALLLGLLLLAAGGAFVLLRRSPEPGRALSSATVGTNSREWAPSPSPARQEPPRQAAMEVSPARTAAAFAEPRPTRAARTTAAPAPASGATESASGSAPPAPALSDRPAVLVDGKTYVGSVTLPSGTRIELGGIVYSDTNANAILNGKIVVPGAVIEGLLLQRIEENRVELANSSGLTIFLALK